MDGATINRQVNIPNDRIRITVLGTSTSQGVPVIGCSCEVCLSTDARDNRLRSSIHIQSSNTSLQIDIGPDFRQQFLNNNLSDVDAVILTHEHNDHVAGLDDIRPINFLHRKSVRLLAEPRVCKEIEKRFFFALDNKYIGAPKLTLETLDVDSEIDFREFTVEPLRIMHGHLPIIGIKIGQFAYLTDVKTLPVETKEKLKNIDTIILSALHHRVHNSHLNLTEALALIDELKPKQAFLTHISHQMGLHEIVEKSLPSNVKLAYDGMQLEFKK